MMVPFFVGLLLGAIATAGSTPSHLRVRQVKVNGRAYRVLSHGAGAYEVFRDDIPTVFLMLNQQGETATSSPSPELEALRTDMRQFPRRLFG